MSETPDLDRVFGHPDAIAVIEDFLHGARSSATTVGDDGPVQHPGRFDPIYTPKLDPLRVDDAYVSPSVREGVASIALRRCS